MDGYDETKFIGIYATNELAKGAILRLRMQPGFRDRPEDFHMSEYEINKDHWVEGYAVMTTSQVKDKNNKWTTIQAECLKDNTYQIIELYDNDSLGEFKHLDIVECDKRDNVLFVAKLVSKHN